MRQGVSRALHPLLRRKSSATRRGHDESRRRIARLSLSPKARGRRRRRPRGRRGSEGWPKQRESCSGNGGRTREPLRASAQDGQATRTPRRERRRRQIWPSCALEAPGLPRRTTLLTHDATHPPPRSSTPRPSGTRARRRGAGALGASSASRARAQRARARRRHAARGVRVAFVAEFRCFAQQTAGDGPPLVVRRHRRTKKRGHRPAGRAARPPRRLRRVSPATARAARASTRARASATCWSAVAGGAVRAAGRRNSRIRPSGRHRRRVRVRAASTSELSTASASKRSCRSTSVTLDARAEKLARALDASASTAPTPKSGEDGATAARSARGAGPRPPAATSGSADEAADERRLRNERAPRAPRRAPIGVAASRTRPTTVPRSPKDFRAYLATSGALEGRARGRGATGRAGTRASRARAPGSDGPIGERAHAAASVPNGPSGDGARRVRAERRCAEPTPNGA